MNFYRRISTFICGFLNLIQRMFKFHTIQIFLVCFRVTLVIQFVKKLFWFISFPESVWEIFDLDKHFNHVLKKGISVWTLLLSYIMNVQTQSLCKSGPAVKTNRFYFLRSFVLFVKAASVVRKVGFETIRTKYLLYFDKIKCSNKCFLGFYWKDFEWICFRKDLKLGRKKNKNKWRIFVNSYWNF